MSRTSSGARILVCRGENFDSQHDRLLLFLRGVLMRARPLPDWFKLRLLR